MSGQSSAIEGSVDGRAYRFRPIQHHGNGRVLRSGTTRPLVHFGLRRDVCVGVCVRLSSGRMAIWSCGGYLGSSRIE